MERIQIETSGLMWYVRVSGIRAEGACLKWALENLRSQLCDRLKIEADVELAQALRAVVDTEDSERSMTDIAVKLSRSLPESRIRELSSGNWSAAVDVAGVAHCASGETRKAAVEQLRRDLSSALMSVSAAQTPPFLAAIESLLPEEHD